MKSWGALANSMGCFDEDVGHVNGAVGRLGEVTGHVNEVAGGFDSLRDVPMKSRGM